MNWKQKIAVGAASLVLGTTGALAWHINRQAPEPIQLKKDAPFRLEQVAEEYTHRFGESLPWDALANAPLVIKLTQGDRILAYGENRELTSYFVEGKDPQSHTEEELEKIVAKKIDQPSVKLDVYHSQEIETVPQQDIRLAPEGYNQFATKLRHGWRQFQREQEPQEPTSQKRTDFFSDPGTILQVSKHQNSQHQGYPYTFSPAVEGVEYEYSFLQDFDKQRILRFFDNISNVTAQKLMKAADSDNLEETLRRYRTTIERKGEIMKAIASSLREANIIYHEEELWSRAFDPKLHQGDFFHLDCDLLAYTFLHIASRLDLPLYAVSAPKHLYVEWRDAEHRFAVETTNFRNEEVQGNIINKAGRDLGKFFFPSYDYMQKKYRVDQAVQRHARFFEPIREADLHTALKVGTISCILEQAIQKYTSDIGLEQRTLNEMKALAQRSDDIQLHTNLYAFHVNKAGKAFQEKQYETAKAMSDKAIGILERHQNKILKEQGGSDYELRARIFKKLGKESAALADYHKAVQWYEQQGVTRITQGANEEEEHARARFYVGKDVYQKGDIVTAFNRYLGFTVNFLLNNEPEDEKLYEAFRLGANVFKNQDQEAFKKMDMLAKEHGF